MDDNGEYALTTMSARSLRLYFDYISPYSYLAWQRAPAFATRHGLTLVAKPVVFAGLLNHHGHKGPAEIPAKRIYMFKECLRRAAVLGVPLAPPYSHPFNPLLPLRVTGLDMEEEQRTDLVGRLFRAAWTESLDVTDPEVVQSICTAGGLPDAVERAGEPAAKKRLLDTGAEALSHGVFGVPTLLIDDELFFGDDSFGHIELYLAGKDPLGDIERWDRIPASARRREHK